MVPWLELSVFTARAWVQSLFGELRYHKLCGGPKNKINFKKTTDYVKQNI